MRNKNEQRSPSDRAVRDPRNTRPNTNMDKLPPAINGAIKNQLEFMRQYLSEKGSDVLLQEREVITNGTALHLAAFCGHLNMLRFLVDFAGKQNLLEVNKEGCSVLDTTLDSPRRSAGVFIYLLFEVKVPFNDKKTLDLLKKKKDLFIEEIKKDFPETNQFPSKSAFYLAQLEDLLRHADEPEWTKKREANFNLPKVLSLFQYATRSSFFLKDLKEKMEILPMDIQEKMTDQMWLDGQDELLETFKLK